MIGDLIYRGLLPRSVAERMIDKLITINKEHMDFLNLGKIVLLISSVGNKIYQHDSSDQSTEGVTQVATALETKLL